MLRKVLNRKIIVGTLLGVGGLYYTQKPIFNIENIPPEIAQHQYFYTQNAVLDQSKELTYPLKTRDDHLEQIKNTQYDVVIIGGGATGGGIALECSQRGLKSVVIEGDDFATGASSKSTKLVHGGVRYLQQVFELSLAGGRLEKMRLVIDALKERSNFLSISSIHTKEIPILIPCNNLFQALFYYSGSLLYHLIYKIYAETNTFQFHSPRIVNKDEIKLYFKNCQAEWGVLYSDGQFNDSRMYNIELPSQINNWQTVINDILTASNIINYTEVRSLIKNNIGNITGVEVFDKIKNQTYKVQGKIVVNATGCFADQIRLMDNPLTKKRIIPSGGSHLILPQQYGSRKWGYLIPETKDGRVLFILPWLHQTILGTTDKQFKEPIKNPTVSQEEQMWLILQYHDQFPSIQPQQIQKDIKSKWCGIRPLVLTHGYAEGDKIDTKQVSRNHVVEISESGLVSVMGGKWTIYRQMGEDTVDHILKQLQQVGDTNQPRQSISKHIKLIGEFDRNKKQPIQNRKAYIKKYASILSKQYSLNYKDAKYFISSYGDRSFDILKLSQQNPQYCSKLHPDMPHTVGEVVYLIRYEMAIKPQDMIFRRTRLGFLDASMIENVYKKINDIYAQELNWTKVEKEQNYKDNLIHIRSLNF